MKELSLEELDIMLCSTGYLPPRTEEELLFFNEMYEDYNSHLRQSVDIESILNGTCRIVSACANNSAMDLEHSCVAEDDSNAYSMAARNFDKLPNEVLDRMKKQHKPKDKNEK